MNERDRERAEGLIVLPGETLGEFLLARHVIAQRACEEHGHAPGIRRYDWANRQKHETAFMCPRCGACWGDEPAGPTLADLRRR